MIKGVVGNDNDVFIFFPALDISFVYRCCYELFMFETIPLSPLIGTSSRDII
ncbi:MAG TPA: hypothetical protein VMS35_01055 [Nitrososphaeraceae archaeon]|nr:hypothetical protein [Nitrososphaeraceae archaeon]